MKKFFIIVVLAIISTSSFSTEVVVNDTTALTFNKVYEDVKEGIQGLAIALKEPAEHVYKVVLRQQTINSVSYLFTWLVLISVAFTFNWWKRAIDEAYDKEYHIIGFLFLCLIPIAIGVIGFIVTISDILTGFINPEYGVIRDIMNFIK